MFDGLCLGLEASGLVNIPALQQVQSILSTKTFVTWSKSVENQLQNVTSILSDHLRDENEDTNKNTILKQY